MFSSSIRSRLQKLLADICPGDLNTFMFPSSGAEANEGALRLARRFTGRNKIMTRHRSYHGGTTAALTATGDFRKWAGEGLASGDFVKFWDPYPYSFSLGATEEEVCTASLAALAEAVAYEGPHNVAAIMIESITGTNGVLPPPAGYLEGLRALCDQHGILLICDEVMAGFGRSGKLFGFSHAQSVSTPSRACTSHPESTTLEANILRIPGDTRLGHVCKGCQWSSAAPRGHWNASAYCRLLSGEHLHGWLHVPLSPSGNGIRV